MRIEADFKISRQDAQTLAIAPSRDTRSCNRWLGAIAACMTFFWGSLALAQISGGGSAGGMPGSGFPSGHHSLTSDRPPADSTNCAAPPSYSARANDALLATKGALRLNGDQEPAWDKFEARVRQLLADALKPKGGHGISVLTMHAPQLDEQALDPARDQLTALEDVNDSSKVLYGALTSEQQGIADARLPQLFHLLVAEAMRSAGGTEDSR